MFGSKSKGIRISWRKVHNEDLHSLYTLPKVIRMIKLRSMRWVVHVAYMGEMRNAYGILMGKEEGQRPLQNLDVEGRKIFNRILDK